MTSLILSTLGLRWYEAVSAKLKVFPQCQSAICCERVESFRIKSTAQQMRIKALARAMLDF